jgi:hypothetical protein
MSAAPPARPRSMFPEGCTCPEYGRGLSLTRVHSATCPVHRELPERERRALEALADAEGCYLSPRRVQLDAGDYRPGVGASAGWRNTLLALARRGLVRVSYSETHGRSALFAITDAGRAALGGQ